MYLLKILEVKNEEISKISDDAKFNKSYFIERKLDNFLSIDDITNDNNNNNNNNNNNENLNLNRVEKEKERENAYFEYDSFIKKKREDQNILLRNSVLDNPNLNGNLNPDDNNNNLISIIDDNNRKNNIDE